MRRLFLSLLCLSPVAALANGYDVPNVNPRDLAMAGSLVADQQTAAAAYANPAALSKLEGFSLDIAGNLLDLRSTWNDTSGAFGTHAQTQVHLVAPPSLNVAYGTRLGGRGFGVGLSVNIPGGGNVFWPENWPGRYRVIVVDRKVYGTYLTAGYELCDRIRIGGGLVYYRTTEHLIQAADPAIPEAQAELAASGGALSYDLSAEIRPFAEIPLTIGIDYKHQGVQNLTGDVHFSNVPLAFQTNPRLQDQAIRHALTYPNALNVGVAYRLRPELLLALGWTFNRYVIYDKDVFVGEKDPSQPIVVPRSYRNGFTYRLGAEWGATSRLTLRAGVLRDVSGMPKSDSTLPGYDGLVSSTYSPTLPDSNTWGAALGFAFAVTPRFTVQGALWHGWMDEVRSSGTDPYAGPGQPFPGLYQTHVWIYGLGLVYRWNPNE